MNTAANGIQYRDCDKGILGQVNDYNALTFTKDDIVLDLGANIGAFSYKLQPIVKQIIAVEPAAENFKVLSANLTGTNVILENKAVTKYNDPPKITFYLASDKSQSMHSTVQVRGRKTIDVDTISIDNLLAYNPTIIKCDIEGGEYDFIKDLKYPDSVKQIATELHLHKKGFEEAYCIAVENMKNQGFKILTEKDLVMYSKLYAKTLVLRRG